MLFVCRPGSAKRTRLPYQPNRRPTIEWSVMDSAGPPNPCIVHAMTHLDSSAVPDAPLEALAAARWRVAIGADDRDDGRVLRIHPAGRVRQAAAGHARRGRPQPRDAAGRAGHPVRVGPDVDLRALGEHRTTTRPSKGCGDDVRLSASPTRSRSAGFSSSSCCRSASRSGRRARRAAPTSSIRPDAASPRSRTAWRLRVTT